MAIDLLCVLAPLSQKDLESHKSVLGDGLVEEDQAMEVQFDFIWLLDVLSELLVQDKELVIRVRSVHHVGLIFQIETGGEVSGLVVCLHEVSLHDNLSLVQLKLVLENSQI